MEGWITKRGALQYQNKHNQYPTRDQSCDLNMIIIKVGVYVENVLT